MIINRAIISFFNANNYILIKKRLSNAIMANKTAVVILAEGGEEMEFVIAVDVLRRAGVNVTIASLTGNELIKCSRGVYIKPDMTLNDINKNNYDCIVLPGGLGGAKAMCESQELGDYLRRQEECGRMIAAICAAPTVLLSHSIGYGKTITSYPSVKDQLTDKYNYIDDKLVVQDGQLVTSRGPGTAFEFALKITEILCGMNIAKDTAKAMLLTY